MKVLAQFCLFVFPWKLRSILLRKLLGWQLDEQCYIGYSIILSEKVVLSRGATIGHLNIIRNLNSIQLGVGSIFGTMNWVAGGASIKESFTEESDRDASLILEEHSAVTHRHIFDCTNKITVGRFSTVAGYRSTFLTHGIDMLGNFQASAPIYIGSYCMIGSNSLVTKGVSIPERSILAAGSVLVSSEGIRESSLLAGVPAKVKTNKHAKGLYFSREEGSVK